MFVGIKNKSELKYIPVEDLKVQGVSLEQLYAHMAHLENLFKAVLNEIDNSHIVKKDTEYLINIDGEIKHIDKLELVAVEELKFPLSAYTIEQDENGENHIVLNKRKVVNII
jgi:Cu/Ag efflux pump CusA